MFRRLSSSLPRDPSFPADLEALGYFINENDEIRMIDHPEENFVYSINRNERVNDIHEEAMNVCIRQIVLERLRGLGLQVLRLPLGASADENHCTILISPDLTSKQRVIVLFPSNTQDLGIFSYRTIRNEGINRGSAVDLAAAILGKGTADGGDRACGLIITNPTQLLWYRGGKRAVSQRQWEHLPRASAVHQSLRIGDVKNVIEGNENYVEHVSYVFQHVIGSMVNKHARIDIIGSEWTGRAVMKYLAANWETFTGRIGGIFLATPQHDLNDLGPEDFARFTESHCRAYFVDPAPSGAVIDGRDSFGCPCFSSGEEYYPENVIIRSWRGMLSWLDNDIRF